MADNTAHFRFYEELNDFLPPKKRKTTFRYHFQGTPGIKDAIEAIGVPHTEIDLILVNSQSVAFDYNLQHGDFVSVYPVFERLDISSVNRLRRTPLRQACFIVDVHLGKLARLLRMLGFDALYRNDYQDPQIIEISVAEKRIILTRDRGILKNSAVTHGYWLRSTNPMEQIVEVLRHFDLASKIKPLERCISCNGLIEPIQKKKVTHLLPPKTDQAFEEFYQCSHCRKIYWPGSHFRPLQKKIDFIISQLKINNEES